MRPKDAPPFGAEPVSVRTPWSKRLWFGVVCAAAITGALAASRLSHILLAFVLISLVAVGSSLLTHPAGKTAGGHPTRNAKPGVDWVLYSLPVLLGFTAVDYSAYLRGTSQPRFGLLLVPLALLAFSPPSDPLGDRPGISASWLPFAALTIYMLVGTIVGKTLLNTANPALSIALAMLIGLIVVRPYTGEREAARLLWWIGTACFIYILLNALALTGHANFLSSDPPGNYRHEKAWIIATGFTALLSSRRYLLLAGSVLLAGYIFFQYSAATYLLVLLVGGGTAVAMRRSARKPSTQGRPNGRLWSGTILVGTIAILVSVLHNRLLGVVTAYYTSVGKQDNSQTRLVALQLTWERVKAAPTWGSLYTGDLSLRVPGYQLGKTLTSIETHNDFLATWMLGGIVALVLLVWWIVAVNVETLRTLSLFSNEDLYHHASLTLASIVLFNSFWAVALFNPLLTQLSAASCMAASYLVLHALSLRARSQTSGTFGDTASEVHV